VFSVTYKLPIFYPLCFDIHPCNGGVGRGSPVESLNNYFNFSEDSPRIVRQSQNFSSFAFTQLQTLSFSVSSKPCICHSYEGNNILDKSERLGYYLACEGRHEHQAKDSPASHRSLRQPR
jgi:hypothetical protein